MLRWLRRLALVALVGVAVRWFVGASERRARARSDVPPTIGGDTWPPVPVNPARER
jgi:hypothetical protein